MVMEFCSDGAAAANTRHYVCAGGNTYESIDDVAMPGLEIVSTGRARRAKFVLGAGTSVNCHTHRVPPSCSC
jgi:hypothetical protein